MEGGGEMVGRGTERSGVVSGSRVEEGRTKG